VLLTVASSVDPQVGVSGFRYAFVASALLSALGLGIALVIHGDRTPQIDVDVVATVAQVPARKLDK